MRCTNPKYIYRDLLYPSGELKSTKISVACGKCEACLLQKQMNWRIRINEEFRSCDGAIFFTLTYDPIYLPYRDHFRFELSGNVRQLDIDTLRSHQLRCHHLSPVVRLSDYICDDDDPDKSDKDLKFNNLSFEIATGIKESTCYKKDIQDFLKRLRKRLQPQKIRYFICSEYGPTTNRPHYHGIIFGLGIDQIVSKAKRLAEIQSLLQDVWQNGFVSADFCNGARCNYVAKYCVKPHGAVSDSRTPPFILCSRRPAIGSAYLQRADRVNWHLEELKDTYVAPNFSNSKQIFQTKLPRYYVDRIFEHDQRALLTLRHRAETLFGADFEISELLNLDDNTLLCSEESQRAIERPKTRSEYEESFRKGQALKEKVHNIVKRAHKGGRRSKDV